MLIELTPEQKRLADIMSEISERCYFASWLINLEYVLWNAMKNGERKYGHDVITKSDIELLNQISSSINSWIYFDPISEETAISLDEWEVKYKKALMSNPKVITG